MWKQMYYRIFGVKVGNSCDTSDPVHQKSHKNFGTQRGSTPGLWFIWTTHGNWYWLHVTNQRGKLRKSRNQRRYQSVNRWSQVYNRRELPKPIHKCFIQTFGTRGIIIIWIGFVNVIKNQFIFLDWIDWKRPKNWRGKQSSGNY